MLYQAILFVVAKSALAHRSHDNPKIELFGSAPSKNKNNWTWWGKNKARKMWVRFEEELKNTITSMYLDEIIERNASSDKTRKNLYIRIEIFAQTFPNWKDAYSFAEQLFNQSPDKANQLIDAVRE